jgi:hypothetical protein
LLSELLVHVAYNPDNLIPLPASIPLSAFGTDADVPSQRILPREEFLGEGFVDDCYGMRVEVIGACELSPFAQRNLGDAEVARAYGKVFCISSWSGFRGGRPSIVKCA